MAETTAREPESPPADLKTFRAEMAQTRTALEQKLDELKSRFSDPRPASGKRTTTMAKKKTAASASKSAASKPSSKKKTPAKSSKLAKSITSAKKSVKATKPVRAVKKTAGKVVKKTKEVLGDMLAGAAVGAVKGAAEAVVPPKKDAR